MSDNISERMTRLETKFDGFESKVDDMSTTMEKGFFALNEKIDKALEKKAGIWVEKVLWGAGAIIGTALLLAGLSILLK